MSIEYRKCDLYYPDEENKFIKKCRNCDRVIKSNKLIEDYKTVTCGKATNGTTASTEIHFILNVREKEKEKELVQITPPIVPLDFELPSITTKIFNFLSSLKDYVADGMVNVSREDYERRLEICNVCPFRDNNSCKKCGCNLGIKAIARAFHCPEKKWPGDEGSV